jgi:hypothetical protein
LTIRSWTPSTWCSKRSQRWDALRVSVGRSRFGSTFHLLEPRVVVGQLPEMHQGDLAGEDGIVIRHVRSGVEAPMFEFDLHPSAERFELDPFAGQVDAEHLGHGGSLLRCEAPSDAVSDHRSPLLPLQPV